MKSYHWQNNEVNFQFLDLQLVAKSGINLIRMTLGKRVLQRWYKAVSPLLKVFTELVVIECR
jgi:hypothetical protein